jgi:PAS domain S-box-containing protein
MLDSFQKDLFTLGPAVLFRWDFTAFDPETGYKVLAVTPNVERLLGYRDEDFLNQKIIYHKIIHPDDLPRVMEEVNYYEKNKQKNYTQHYRLIAKNGEIKHVVDFTVVYFEGDRPVYSEGLLFDNTEFVTLNNRLQDNVDILTKKIKEESIRNQLLRLAAAPLSLQTFFDQAMKKLSEMQYLRLINKMGIFLADDNNALHLVAAYNLPDGLKQVCKRVPFGTCLCGMAAQTGKTQHASCVDHRHTNTYEGITAHGHYNVPILAGNRVLGVMVFYVPEGHPYSPDEEHFLSSIADIIAMRILRERDEKKIAQLEADKLQLADTLYTLLNEIPDAIIMKDGAGRWIYANRTAKEFFGLEDDYLGKTSAEISRVNRVLRDMNLDFEAEDQAALVSKEVKEKIFTVRVADGRVLDLEIRRIVIRDDGDQVTGIIEVGKDVTKQRAAERNLIQIRKRLEEVVKLARVGGFVIDFKQNRVEWMNEIWRLGEVPADFVPDIHNTIRFYKEGESREKALAAIRRAVKEGKGFDIEIEMVNYTGQTFWVRMVGEPEMKGDYCERITGYFQDISEKRKYQDEKEKLEKKFARLVEKSTDVFVLYDRDGIITYASPSTFDVMGYDPQEVIGRHVSEFHHEEERDFLATVRENILKFPGFSFPMQASRLRHKSGHFLFVEGTISNLLNDEAVNAVVVNFRDVTARKQMEADLINRNKKLEEIAWMFAHRVRGPVATLKGLAELFKYLNPNDPLRTEVFAKMNVPLESLDAIIRAIVEVSYENEIVVPEKITGNKM